MISHQHRCIFIHVPKNAGQSIEHVFLKWAGLTWKTRAPLLLRPSADPAEGPPRLAHLKACDYVRCGHLSSQQFKSYFKFSFVRNPWDRMVSFYKYLGIPERQTFKEFLTGQFQNELWPSKYWFVCPQHEYVCDSQGRLMVDFLGRFETLQADFNSVCEKLGVPHTPVPHVNKSKLRRGLRGFLRKILPRTAPEALGTPFGNADYYDEECVEIVHRLYHRDVELFGYRCQTAASLVRLSLTALLMPLLDFGF
jgi:hypothetical protein